MKPSTFTSNIRASVGKPWEIWRSTNLTDHAVDFYTKSGDVFSYSSMFVIIPDFDVGFVILAAGNSTTSTTEQLTDIVAANIVPALEDLARAQSQQKYAGTYASTNSSLASNITLTTQPGQPGLIVQGWYSNDTDFLQAIAGFEKATTGVDVRLYPTGLVQQVSPTMQRISYRALFESLSTNLDGGVFSADCETWASTDLYTYGNVGIEEFLFEVENGKVVSISPRVLRTTLKKTA